MPTARSIAAILLCSVIVHAEPAVAQVDQMRAQEYFNEVHALCDRDAGRLWGVYLCLPMVIVDRPSQTLATSQAPPEGPRPQVLGLVNAPVRWGNATWATYMWSFVEGMTPRRRNELFIHEMFHGVQPQLGLLAQNDPSEHLDTAEGRYWMRLEWRALARALRASGKKRELAISDALAFRQARRMHFPDGVESERAGEITEGLAAYTATAVVADSTADAVASATDLLADFDSNESFVRTFAYASGPAYGVLLDAASPDWRRKIRASDDLGMLLMRALAIRPTRDASAAAGRYAGSEIHAFEQRRSVAQQQRVSELRKRFVDGPVLVIRGGGRGSFNSQGAVVIPGVGTIYFGPFSASGDWGQLSAEKGVLVLSNSSTRQLPAPLLQKDGSVAGDGWSFKPAPGWLVREGPRAGDYEVVPQ